MTPAERAEYARLEAACTQAMQACLYHPVPQPKPGSRIIPKGCTCFTKTKAWKEFMSWESPTCNICGGRDKCKPDCEALDKRS